MNIKKIDKYFQYFENINDLITSIYESLKDKTINIKIKNKKCELEITNPILKKKFNMNIPIKEKSVQNEIFNIIPKIEELNLKVQKLEKENAELIKKVNYLMEKEEKREKELNDEQQSKQNINNFFKESNIIKNEDRKFILSLLPNKPTRTKLLYDSRINGDTAKAFHSSCDGKSPTIYIVKSSTGYIFGGYLSQSWISENEYYKQ